MRLNLVGPPNRYWIFTTIVAGWVWASFWSLPNITPCVHAEEQDQVATLRIRFGMKDTEPTDWSGKLLAGQAKVEAIRSWRWSNADSAEGNAWTVHTRRATAQGAAQRQRVAAGLVLPMSDNGIIVTLTNCPSDQEITFDAKPATFSFRLAQLALGETLSFEAGRVTVERVPTTRALAATTADEDYPTAAVGKDGAVYVVYLSFTRGRDFQGLRERPATKESGPIGLVGTPVRMIQEPADLAYLAQPAGGEQLYLRVLRDGRWGEPIAVTDGKDELYRPAVSVAGDGRVWVFYSAHLGADENLDYGNWELMARSFSADGSDAGEAINVSRTTGSDFMPAAATDGRGNVWVTWVGARGSNFHVFSAHQQDGRFSSPRRVSQFDGNEWEPAIAADARGNLAIAWDTFDKGDYDVYVALRSGEGEPAAPQAVAASAAFEVRPSLAYDHDGQLWIAYEYSGDQWGKDFGALKKKGIPLYQTGRSLGLKVLGSGGQWSVPDDVMQAMPMAGNRGGTATRAPNRNPITAIAPTYPRLACDELGHIWLAFRGKPGTNWRVGVGTVWCEYVTRLGADGWAKAVWLPHSNNILDNRPALAPLDKTGMLAVFSGDGRGEVNPLDMEDVHLPGASDDTETAEAPPTQPRRANRREQADPNNQLLVSMIGAADFSQVPGAAKLKPIAAEKPAAPTADIAVEREDIQRMRDYRVQLGDETLQIWRGEFHRHTELSPDGGGDGGLLDMWRYAIDAAGMDWIGDGDHDYGIGREYSWWTTQKAVTLFTLPGHFTPVYSYERSVRYPEGHRNCMFAYRGVRSLPRLPISSPDVFAPAPDTNLLYMYLHYFDGICASHTCATNMGTDWRNHDPVVEPFVEIYQGDRNNYERPDAPRSAVPLTRDPDRLHPLLGERRRVDHQDAVQFAARPTDLPGLFGEQRLKVPLDPLDEPLQRLPVLLMKVGNRFARLSEAHTSPAL